MSEKQKRDLYWVNKDGYIVIKGFMLTELCLEKTELMVYALIYSYNSNGRTFTGTREYISQWTGSKKSAVDAALKNLQAKEYIVKTVRKQGSSRIIEYGVKAEHNIYRT